MDPRRPRAQAVALHGARIAVVGTNTEVLRLRGRGTTHIPCYGEAIVPGFIDPHLHLRAYIGTLLGIDCSPRTVRSLAELRGVLQGYAQRQPPGQWLVGHGYDPFAFPEGRHPTRWDLDGVTPRHPVRLAHRSRHAWVLNSLALAQLGITRDFVPPPGGVVERNPQTGEPTGLLIDMEGYLRGRVPPTASPAEFREGVRRASRNLLSAGVTTIQDASVGNDLTTCETFGTWGATGDLGVRASVLLGWRSLGDVIAAGLGAGGGSPSACVQGVKIRLDEGSGALYPPQDTVNELVWTAHRHGFPVAIHALDPPALVSALHAIRLARTRLPRPELRHRIEHCALCPDALLDELAELRVTVVTQPSFLWHHGPRYLAEIEPEQHPWLYRVKSFLDRGIPVAGSSDAPVVPPHPLQGVSAAATRQTPDGRSIGPAERIGVEAAVWLFTQGGAWACGREAELGSIAPGKLADLVVLHADPTRVPPQQIREIAPRMTIVDGIVRWKAEDQQRAGLGNGRPPG
jgi:predicted amidohydrolase YtcJ